MRKKLLQCLLVGISLLMSSLVWAQCTEGKSEIEIITPSGRSNIICVPDAAITGLENAGSHADSVIVTAECPCFSLNDISDVLATYSHLDYCNGSSIGEEPYAHCFINDPRVNFHSARSLVKDLAECTFERTDQGIDIYQTGLSVSEVRACVGLLEPNFIPGGWY